LVVTSVAKTATEYAFVGGVLDSTGVSSTAENQSMLKTVRIDYSVEEAKNVNANDAQFALAA
jgi:hypothetical protein